jgi:protein-L-isoaspartate(D-aspartate) O-methyltransferase
LKLQFSLVYWAQLFPLIVSLTFFTNTSRCVLSDFVTTAHYCPNKPYEDSPQRIGFNVTISAPYMHAHALEEMEAHLHPGASVLDVGCGSGYLLTAMSHMVGETGKVYGIDYIKGLIDLSISNMMKADGALLESKRVEVILADGWAGLPASGPYDCIHVGAAAAAVPEALLDQLKPGGCMIIPVGPQGGKQHLVKIVKDPVTGTGERTNLMGVRYVPLVQPIGLNL